MGSEWKSVPFRELYAIPSRNGLTKPKKIRGEGYKFINMGEIFSYGRMLNIECDRAPATDKELETSTLKAGDLLFARQSLVLSGAGKCSIFLGDDETTIFESHLIRVRPDAKQVLPEYLYYYFDSPIGRSEIWSITEQGAGQAGIRGSDLETVLVRLPSLAKQEKIVSILQAIDNKIALNRQINTTLESMAQALFKSWFVDFDPVIDNALAAGNEIPDELAARAARRETLRQQTNKTANETSNKTLGATDAVSSEQALPDTGLSDQRLPSEIQQLFPDRFVFTEDMGWVPEGWEAVRFSQLVDAKQGKYLAKTEMMESQNDAFQYPVWGGNGILGYSQKKSYDAPITLMTCRGSNCGLIKTTQSSSWISNNSFACKSRYGSEYFLYLYFISEDFSDCVSGSAQPQITYTALKNKLMKYPISTEICNVFSELVAVYREKQFLNDRQNELLTNLRDSLLPKLLSGQITIPDAGQQLAGVL